MKIRKLRTRWKYVIPVGSYPYDGIKRGSGKVYWVLVEGEHPITYDEIDYWDMIRWK